MRCITTNMLQTKMDAQCDKLVTEVSDSACDGQRFRVTVSYLSKVANFDLPPGGAVVQW